MTIYETLKEYLTVEPKARERTNKNRAIGNLMRKKYFPGIDVDPAVQGIPKDKMADMVGEILSADRAWRKVLEENESLRGSDYGDKEILEQEKMLELGYQPGHEADVKKLKNL